MTSRSSKVGMICLATDQGLGYLARDFYKAGLIDYVYIHEHTTRTNHRNWYPRESIVSSYEELIEKSDTIFAIETFFNWKIVPQAREKGKKTVLMPMYECTGKLPYFPDELWCPSDLDMDVYTEMYPDAIIAGNGAVQDTSQTILGPACMGEEK